MSFIAFRELLSEKQVGFSGAGPIPWSAIKDWGAFHGVSSVDEVAVLVDRIRALEAVYNEHQAKAQSSKKGGST